MKHCCLLTRERSFLSPSGLFAYRVYTLLFEQLVKAHLQITDINVLLWQVCTPDDISVSADLCDWFSFLLCTQNRTGNAGNKYSVSAKMIVCAHYIHGSHIYALAIQVSAWHRNNLTTNRYIYLERNTAFGRWQPILYNNTQFPKRISQLVTRLEE